MIYNDINSKETEEETKEESNFSEGTENTLTYKNFGKN